jgi:hypothetical protein
LNLCRHDDLSSTSTGEPGGEDCAQHGVNHVGGAQFSLLHTERQLTLDGRAEPLISTRLPSELPVERFHGLADAAEPQGTYEAQAELFGWPQAQLPLHPLVDGKPNRECYEPRGGFRAKGDAHAVAGPAPRVTPQCCNRQACASSAEGNSAERSRDLWNGTKAKGERLGLRHVVGQAALAVLVVTIPPELRPSARDAKIKLKRWEKAIAARLVELLRRKVGHADAEFYLRANIHPCGENAQQWKPHLNFLVPAVALLPSLGVGKRFNPYLELAELREAVSEAQAEVFGTGENAGCYWQYHQGEGEKRHQASYVPRVFPEWTHLKLRPATYGLSHGRSRAKLEAALDSLNMKPLPVWAHTELREGLEPAPLTGRGPTEADAAEAYEVQLQRHRETCESCAAASSYPEHRRTKSVSSEVLGPSPPSTAPPELSQAANAARWQRFLQASA